MNIQNPTYALRVTLVVDGQHKEKIVLPGHRVSVWDRKLKIEPATERCPDTIFVCRKEAAMLYFDSHTDGRVMTPVGISTLKQLLLFSDAGLQGVERHPDGSLSYTMEHRPPANPCHGKVVIPDVGTLLFQHVAPPVVRPAPKPRKPSKVPQLTLTLIRNGTVVGEENRAFSPQDKEVGISKTDLLSGPAFANLSNKEKAESALFLFEERSSDPVCLLVLHASMSAAVTTEYGITCTIAVQQDMAQHMENKELAYPILLLPKTRGTVLMGRDAVQFSFDEVLTEIASDR